MKKYYCKNCGEFKSSFGISKINLGYHIDLFCNSCGKEAVHISELLDDMNTDIQNSRKKIRELEKELSKYRRLEKADTANKELIKSMKVISREIEKHNGLLS